MKAIRARRSSFKPIFCLGTNLLAISLTGNAAEARVVQVGNADYPTLASAVAAVPDLRSGMNASEALELVLPPGVVRLTAPVVIDATHGGTALNPLLIRGAADGSTVLTGAIVLTARPARIADAPGIPLASGTLALDLPMSLGDLSIERRNPHIATPVKSVQIFQAGTWLPLSRWPLAGSAIGATAVGSTNNSAIIPLPPTAPKFLHNEEALMASGYWGADWEYERLPIQSMAVDGLHLAALQSQQPIRPHVRFWVENGVSILSPGHIAIVPSRRIALLLPMAGARIFEATLAQELVRLDHAANVTISNIALTQSGGKLLAISGAQDIRIDNCHLSNAAGDGLVVNGGTNVLITRTSVSHIGERGVVLSGGVRQSLTPGGHAFADGYVSDFGRLEPSYRPAVYILGVGNRLSGTVIADGKHAGVVLDGNNHIVTDNEIKHVLQDTDDAGAIYMGADWTQRGNIISDNFIHDLGSDDRATHFLSAVYLDDQFSSATISGNVIVGGDYGVVIGGGRDNRVVGNLIAFGRRGALSFDSRGAAKQIGRLAEFTRKLQNMPTQSALWRSQYPALATLNAGHYGKAEGNVWYDNLIFRSESSIGPVISATDGDLKLLAQGNNVERRVPVQKGSETSIVHQPVLPEKFRIVVRPRRTKQ
ncbi:right-handed parallel beta-helix repeat-containing protein [Novosphingobium resinovorum]|uniref:right-handed parallel beta-helix repeat-containing protein n=1 Tax=Novosphingobium TaxID=165696 RepID=UPI001B3C97C1|nr:MULTISPECIES: right-handed parallel beta-helix repeat-containing protein [Novosphingobium]MBF7012800.1 right-handed parallel beta-helix repeat-containing protein [Novosphingobium sp. HR1a]WJM27537.1 right-handed parallel beta-helix repeat-containing protein [Novosphingobium resinovorum]